MGNTNIAAYTKTFPDKYQSFLDRGVASKDIASYITAYNKSKLCMLIYEQSLTPLGIINADKAQQAINTLSDIMLDGSVIPRDRVAAATALLVNLKRPEAQKIELDIAVKEDSSIIDLRANVKKLVDMQRNMINTGTMTAKQIAHSDLIIDVTPEEVA
jgi:hypothetical protein